MKLQDANLFPIIAVTGPLGQGKSTFSLQWAIRHQIKRFDESYFSIKKYVAYDNEEVRQKYYTLSENSPLIADEAARFAMSQDWNKAINKELKKTTMQLRPRHLLFFLNIPNFSWLDRVYRDELVSLWVWIPTRSYAIAFRPDNNPGEKDRWHLKDFEVKYRIDSFSDIDLIEKLVRKHKCYFDTFKFPPLPKDMEDEYNRLREKRTFLEAGERFYSQKELAKIAAYNIRFKWQHILEAVEKSRKKSYPTTRVIADNLFLDPINKIQLVQHTTISNWFKALKEKLPIEAQQKMELEDLPEEDDQDATQMP